MKKIKIFGTMMLSATATLGQELKINAGWDFDRNYKNDDLIKQKNTSSKSKNGYKFSNGPIAGIEWLLDNQGKIEFGIGAEHKFSKKSSFLKDKKETKMFKITPLYLTGKYNVINKNGNDILYTIGRVGYTHVKLPEKINNSDTDDIRGGVYYAGGLGTQLGPVSIEALYERSNLRNQIRDSFNINNIKKSKDKIDTVSIRMGYSIGNTKNFPNRKVAAMAFDHSRTDIFPKSEYAEYDSLVQKKKWNGGELRLNAGYTFKNRYNIQENNFPRQLDKINKKWNSAKSDFEVKKMPVVGLEYIFDNQGTVELGFGAEQKNFDTGVFFDDKEQKHVLKTYPVYLTTKINLVNKDGNNLLYTVGRAGYVHGEIKEENINKKDIRGGFYYAGGLGTELGPVSVEALYESSNFKYQPQTSNIKTKAKIETFGIRVGYRIGSIKNTPKQKQSKKIKTLTSLLQAGTSEENTNITQNPKNHQNTNMELAEKKYMETNKESLDFDEKANIKEQAENISEKDAIDMINHLKFSSL